jgi:hypothetical protein
MTERSEVIMRLGTPGGDRSSTLDHDAGSRSATGRGRREEPA